METTYLNQTLNQADAVKKISNAGVNFIVPRQAKPSEQEFVFLLKKVKSLFDLAPGDNIHQFIATSTHELMNYCIIFVTVYNEGNDTLNVRGVAGLGNHTEKIMHMIGNNPGELSTPVTETCRLGLLSGRLTCIAGGMYELANHCMPRIMCIGVEEFLSIKATYAMGITWHEKILGSIGFLSREEIRDSTIIETYINYAALAIQRRTEKISEPVIS